MHAIVTERAEEIRQLVGRVLEVDQEQLTASARFVEDLEADSMKLLELLANLEIEFEVDVDEDEFARLVNLDGVYAVLSSALDG